MLDAFLKGLKSVFTWKSLGGFAGVALLFAFVAWLGWTPERFASSVPGPRELWDRVAA